MGLNDKIREKFDFTVDKTKSEILGIIEIKKKNQRWADFLHSDIDFKEVTAINGQLEILRKPTGFSPFRPYGKIIIKISDINDSKSKLTGETLPYNGFLPTALLLIFGLIGLWTVGVFLTVRINMALLMTFFVWTAFALILFLQYRYYKSELLNYAKRFVSEICEHKKASR